LNKHAFFIKQFS